jgi:hypothetical protein
LAGMVNPPVTTGTVEAVTQNHTVGAVSSGVTAVVHVAHAGLVIGGAALVLAMLSPLAIRRRRAALAELRQAAASGNLVRLAELRASSREQTDHAIERRPALLIAVTGSLIAAGVHVAVCPEHFREALRFGIFFVLISLFQTAWCVAVVRRPTRVLFLAGAVVNAGCVVLWAITRTVGLPFGLSEVEAVGAVDLVATIAEVATVIGCASCLGLALSLRSHAVVSGGGA